MCLLCGTSCLLNKPDYVRRWRVNLHVLLYKTKDKKLLPRCESGRIYFLYSISRATIFGRITATRNWEAGHWNIVSLFQTEKSPRLSLLLENACLHSFGTTAATAAAARGQTCDSRLQTDVQTLQWLQPRISRGRRSKKRRSCLHMMTPDLKLVLQWRYISSPYNFFHALPTAHIRRRLTSSCLQITRKVS